MIPSSLTRGSHRTGMLLNTDEHGCIGGDVIVLTEQCPTRIYAPNAFSPNNDGINDRFQLYAFDITRLEWKIYDRWGNEVFVSEDPKDSWDGNWKGGPAGSGVYVWMVSFDGYREDGSTYSGLESGSMTLIR